MDNNWLYFLKQPATVPATFFSTRLDSWQSSWRWAAEFPRAELLIQAFSRGSSWILWNTDWDRNGDVCSTFILTYSLKCWEPDFTINQIYVRQKFWGLDFCRNDKLIIIQYIVLVVLKCYRSDTGYCVPDDISGVYLAAGCSIATPRLSIRVLQGCPHCPHTQTYTHTPTHTQVRVAPVGSCDG